MKDNKSGNTQPNPLLNHSGTVKGYFMAKMRRMYRRDRFELLKPIVKAITSKWFIRRKLIDFKSYYEIADNNKLEVLFEKNVTLNYSSVKFHDEINDENIYSVKNHYRYALKLSDVMVIGSSDLILLDDKYALYDLRFLDIDNAFDYTDYAIKFLKNDVCVLEANWADFVIDKAILLGANYSINYYHFVIEVIAKFKTLSYLKIEKTVPILIDQSCLDIPQYVELLSYFNTDNRAIIPIKKEIIYKVSTLYHISVPNIIPPNFKNITNIQAQHNLFDPSSLTFIRNKLLSSASAVVDTPNKIFISRKNASGRRVYNEDEVYKLLKKYGFSIIYPEEYSITEQITLFNKADFIVGATGAAFTNLLFCQETCRVICLTNFNINLSIFCTIARLFNIELTYLYDDELVLKVDSDLHSNFIIKIDKLERALLDRM